jgi:hypothetical protein
MLQYCFLFELKGKYIYIHHFDGLLNRKFTSTRQDFEACVVTLDFARTPWNKNLFFRY